MVPLHFAGYPGAPSAPDVPGVPVIPGVCHLVHKEAVRTAVLKIGFVSFML